MQIPQLHLLFFIGLKKLSPSLSITDWYCGDLAESLGPPGRAGIGGRDRIGGWRVAGFPLLKGRRRAGTPVSSESLSLELFLLLRNSSSPVPLHYPRPAPTSLYRSVTVPPLPLSPRHRDTLPATPAVIPRIVLAGAMQGSREPLPYTIDCAGLLYAPNLESRKSTPPIHRC